MENNHGSDDQQEAINNFKQWGNQRTAASKGTM